MATHRYKGFTICRGSYTASADDRLDRWYVAPSDADLRDRRGSGFRTLADAKAAIREQIELEEQP